MLGIGCPTHVPQVGRLPGQQDHCRRVPSATSAFNGLGTCVFSRSHATIGVVSLTLSGILEFCGAAAWSTGMIG